MAQAKVQGVEVVHHQPYDPMALYARVLRFYQGAITDEQLERMHFRRFFGYLREAELIAENERKAYSVNQSSNQEQELQRFEAQLPKQVEYEGEVVEYGRQHSL